MISKNLKFDFHTDHMVNRNLTKILLGIIAGGAAEVGLLLLILYIYNFNLFPILIISGLIAGLIVNKKDDDLIAGFVGNFLPVFIILVIVVSSYCRDPAGCGFSLIGFSLSFTEGLLFGIIFGGGAGVLGIFGAFISRIIRKKR